MHLTTSNCHSVSNSKYFSLLPVLPIAARCDLRFKPPPRRRGKRRRSTLNDTVLKTPSAVCQAGEQPVHQSALVRVTAAARCNTSGRRGRGGGWLRRKYQLPIARAVTFSVILLPLRRETHRAAGRWWNNAALFRNTPRCYSQSSAVKCRRAGSFKATEGKLFICICMQNNSDDCSLL